MPLLQLGRCAFTAACNFPGPRYRIHGTNRTVCGTHARVVQLAIEQPVRVPADSAAQLHAPQAPGRSSFSVLDVRSTSKGPRE